MKYQGSISKYVCRASGGENVWCIFLLPQVGLKMSDIYKLSVDKNANRYPCKWKRLSVDAPSRDVPSLSVFLPKSRQRMSRRHVTSWRRAVTSRDVGCPTHDVIWYEPAQVNLSENPKIMFFKLATLTFDLWPWPSNLSEILSRSIPPPNFESIRSTL